MPSVVTQNPIRKRAQAAMSVLLAVALWPTPSGLAKPRVNQTRIQQRWKALPPWASAKTIRWDMALMIRYHKSSLWRERRSGHCGMAVYRRFRRLISHRQGHHLNSSADRRLLYRHRITVSLHHHYKLLQSNPATLF
jgi:hypothetical protein